MSVRSKSIVLVQIENFPSPDIAVFSNPKQAFGFLKPQSLSETQFMEKFNKAREGELLIEEELAKAFFTHFNFIDPDTRGQDVKEPEVSGEFLEEAKDETGNV